MLIKLLNNPVSIKILKMLSTKPLSIPQIAKLLDIEISIVFAILGELYHYNLVQQSENPESDNNSENFKQLNKNTISFNDYQFTLSKPLLGIPLPDYISFWEEIQNHPNNFNYNKLDQWTFSVPSYMASQISGCSLDEIKKKILGQNR